MNRLKLFATFAPAPFIFLASLLISGCSLLVGNATQSFGNGLSDAILNSQDVETVRQGLPAYLLLLDGMITNRPKDTKLLLTAAQLNSAYAGTFSQNKAQAQALTQKALDYALTASCQSWDRRCTAKTMTFAELEELVRNSKPTEIESLYILGSSWASWIEQRTDDWNAIADIARVQLLMQRVVALDASYEMGAPHLYLGVLSTLLPAALGGKPEVGRAHYEQAIALSEGRNLMAKVLFARRYARLLFDRELHDRLLKEVLEAPVESPGLTLSNLLAQQQAKTLLAQADDYF